MRPPAALACPNFYRTSLPTTARNTLNFSDWFCVDCVHTALSCNIGSFSREYQDNPGLVGGIAVAALIKTPLEHEFCYSAQLLAFDMTVCRLSNLDRKRHACVKLNILSRQLYFWNWNRNKRFKLSVDSNPQTINCERCRKSRQCDTIGPLSALVDRVHLLMPLGTPRYNTFVMPWAVCCVYAVSCLLCICRELCVVREITIYLIWRRSSKWS